MPEVRDYIDAVMRYFPQGNIDTHVGMPSPAAVLVEFLEEKLSFDDDVAANLRVYEQARYTIEHNIRTQEENWSKLCIAFAKLKIASTTTDYLKGKATT